MTSPFKLLGVAIAAALVFGAGPARADVFVFADATKTKFVNVNKNVSIQKDVSIFADAFIALDSTSEQDIFANQRNQWNFAEDELSTATNTISGSYDGASGEQVTIQNNGFNNNNLNSDSLSYSNSPGFGDGAFTDAEVNIEQINGFVEVPNGQLPPIDQLPEDFDGRGVNVFETIEGVTYDNFIDTSFNEAAGVAKTIQENGSNNNNFNGVAIALADFAVFALDEVNAGQFNNFNFANARLANRTNNVTGSFNGYDGISSTIQSNGANSNNANTSAISASLSAAPTPGTPPVGGGL
jgi:hypothetical protein